MSKPRCFFTRWSEGSAEFIGPSIRTLAGRLSWSGAVKRTRQSVLPCGQPTRPSVNSSDRRWSKAPGSALVRGHPFNEMLARRGLLNFPTEPPSALPPQGDGPELEPSMPNDTPGSSLIVASASSASMSDSANASAAALVRSPSETTTLPGPKTTQYSFSVPSLNTTTK